MREIDHVESSDTSRDSPHERLSLSMLIERASSLTKVVLSPQFSPVEILQKLSGGQPSWFCLPSGVSRMGGVMENKGLCIIFGASDVSDTDGVEKKTSNIDVEHVREEQRWSEMTLFEQPIKIDSRAPLVFYNVWFASHLEVTGCGPVFFSNCCFGTPARKYVPDASSQSLPVASVDLAIEGVCKFIDCDFGGTCAVAGSHEVPTMTARYRTGLSIIDSHFSGSGVVSTALLLLDSSWLEADHMSIVCCCGHGMIVGCGSKAKVFRSLFDQNKGGVWVKDNGNLEIRDSSLRMVRSNRSALFLTEHGRCSAHECTISSEFVWMPPSSKRFIVVACDRSYLLLNACDMSWVFQGDDDDESMDNMTRWRGELLLNPVSPPMVTTGCDSHIQGESLTLCLIMMQKESVVTLTRCILRLPLALESGRRYSIIGVLLSGIPCADSVPLHATQNTVVYACPMERVDVRNLRAESPNKMDTSCCFWGLILPSDSDRGVRRDIRQLAVMWGENNLFLRGADDLSGVSSFLASASYDAYRASTGLLPDASGVKERNIVTPLGISPSVPGGEYCCLATHSVPPGEGITRSIPDSMQESTKTMSLTRLPSGGHTAILTLKKSSLDHSSATSLTSYGDDDDDDDDDETDLLLAGESNGEKKILGIGGMDSHNDTHSQVDMVSLVAPSGGCLCAGGGVSTSTKSSLVATTAYNASPMVCAKKRLHNTAENATTLQLRFGSMVTSKSGPSLPTSSSGGGTRPRRFFAPVSPARKNGNRQPICWNKKYPPSKPDGAFHNKGRVTLPDVQEEADAHQVKRTTLHGFGETSMQTFRNDGQRFRRRSTRTNSTPVSSFIPTTLPSGTNRGRSLRKWSHPSSMKAARLGSCFASGLSLYLPDCASRRRLPTFHGKQSSHRRDLEDASATTEVWPWDVEELQVLLRKKFGLYENFKDYERAFYTVGMNTKERMGEVEKKHHRIR